MKHSDLRPIGKRKRVRRNLTTADKLERITRQVAAQLGLEVDEDSITKTRKYLEEEIQIGQQNPETENPEDDA